MDWNVSLKRKASSHAILPALIIESRPVPKSVCRFHAGGTQFAVLFMPGHQSVRKVNTP